MDTHVTASAKEVLEEALEIMKEGIPLTLVQAMQERTSRYQDRVGMSNLRARYNDTRYHIAACSTILKCIPQPSSIADWDEVPGRTHADRIKLLNEAIAKA